MRDNLMGGLLAFGVAAPVMIVCCGGGAALLAAVSGGIGAWLSGLGGLSIALLVALAYLVVREIWRAQNDMRSPVILQTKRVRLDPNQQ